MGLRESFDTTDQTHRVVTRTSVVSNNDGAGSVEIENTVVEVAMRYGTAVHICIDGEILENCSPETLTAVRQLTRLRDFETVLMNAYPEYRAILPDDADIVTTCLDPGGDDAWLARLFGTYELAVVTEGDWLYRSAPHHSHIREVNAAVDGFLDDVADALDPIRGAAVFPVDALVSWQSDGYRYEIVPEFERFRITEVEQEDRTAFPLNQLSAVYPNEERLEIVFHWHTTTGAESPVVRGFQRLFTRFSTDPPVRIGVPDHETLDEVLETLRTVAAKLDYEFTVHE
jgi:hypothetical protein